MDWFNNGLFDYFVFITEVPHDGLLKRKPANRNENLITRTRLKHSINQTIKKKIHPKYQKAKKY